MEKFTRLKYGLYMSNVCMSIVSSFIPLLFVAFHEMYFISYTSLGFLVLINFATQLFVDLIYSIFSKKLNVEISVKVMPLITLIGLLFLAITPMIIKDVYVGIVIGVIIISASSGIAEVLISRVIAAIPSPNPDGEMSKLHSIFAFGVVGTVVFSTIFIKIFTFEFWQILSLILCIVPLSAIFLLIGQKFPYMTENDNRSDTKPLKSWTFALCVLCIILGAATENIMSQWVSSYIEIGLQIDKIYGDLFGVALFSLFLGLGRFLYSKFGKNITKILVLSAVMSFVLYLLSALVPNPYIALIACALAGFSTAMLWPGTLIASSPKFECAGVAMFALLAAGGDLGASIAPQIMGSLTDAYINNATIIEYATSIGVSSEIVAMRVALLSVSIFPLLLIFVTLALYFVLKSKKSK